MILQKAEMIVNDVLKELNKTDVTGYTFHSPATTDTTISNSGVTDDGTFFFNLYSSDLKFGGIDDEDHNDALMEENLIKAFSKIFKKLSKTVKLVSFQGQYKGYWDVYLESTDGPKKNVLNKRTKLRNEIEKYKSDLTLFNDKVRDRIVNQKSKKKTCPNCDSNINVKYFKSHKCPLCCTEMYTDTDKKRVSNLKERISNREAELKKLFL